ncbi:MAG TPA: adenylate/guanylate cyclase domain-containing protein, partial [Dehalococcoidia bacterium]|nr:adenylate/guanylate cyclase domain-containing protein [Dehalococcoidia bacterium]
FGRDVPSPLPIKGNELDLFGRTAPLERGKAFRINYAGPARPADQGGSFLALPFDDVRTGNFDPAAVSGKVVIVGALASALDVQPAPLLDTAYGTEIHANAVDTLLRDRFLRTTGDLTTFLTTIVLVVAAALFLPRWRPLFSLATVTGFIVIYAVFGVYMFSQGWIIDFVDPPVGLVIATVVALSYSVISERNTAREMQELFGRYVSPQVAQTLVHRADRGQLKLGGELREVTVLFGDIRGFTPLSARMPPDQLVALLNENFGVIISRIMENGGIINKFAGDAVMAFWNAPDNQPGHALSACRAALDAQDDLEKLSDAPIARWGFGISTGVALAGNVGSGRRLEYTVIGDSVNLGARLCGVAPAGEVWINGNTYEQVRGVLEVEELPPQPIKGIEGPVTAYRLKRPVAQEPLGVGGKL